MFVNKRKAFFKKFKKIGIFFIFLYEKNLSQAVPIFYFVGITNLLANAKTNSYNINNTPSHDDDLACGLILKIINHERISSPPSAGNHDTLYVLWPRKTKMGGRKGDKRAAIVRR